MNGGLIAKGVDLTESYDVHAVWKDGLEIEIQVRGTTADGSGVVLTQGEVELRLAYLPTNAFAVVGCLRPTRASDTPRAANGELVLEMPWHIHSSRLLPLARRYCTRAIANPTENSRARTTH